MNKEDIIVYTVCVNRNSGEVSHDYEIDMINMWAESLIENGNYSGDIVAVVDREDGVMDEIDTINVSDNQHSRVIDVTQYKTQMSEILDCGGKGAVFYCDMDILFTRDIQPLLDILEWKDLILGVEGGSQTALIKEGNYRNKDVYIRDIVKGEIDEKWYDEQRLNAGTILVRTSFIDKLCNLWGGMINRSEEINSDQKALTAAIIENNLEYGKIPESWIHFPYITKGDIDEDELMMIHFADSPEDNLEILRGIMRRWFRDSHHLR